MFQLPNISVILPIVITFREIGDYYQKTIEQLKLQHYLRIYSKQYYDVLLLAYKVCAFYREDFEFLFPSIKYNFMDISRCDGYNNLHEAGIIFNIDKSETKFVFEDVLTAMYRVPIGKIEFTNGDTLLITNNKELDVFVNKIGNEIMRIQRDTFPHLCEKNIEIRQWEGNIYVQSQLQIGEFKEFINKKENRFVFKIE